MINRYLARFKLDRYHYTIDLLRGVAALMVVVYHFVAFPGRFSDFGLLQKVASLGHFGVQIFFVISGFVIPNSMFNAKYKFKDIGRFMLKRLVRLEPPYIVSIIFCILLAYASLLSPYYRGKPPEISLPQVLLHLGYLNTYFKYDWLNVVYWSLAIEFQFYLVMAFLFPLLIYQKRDINLILWMAICALALLFPEKEFIFRHAPFFSFGVILFLFKRGRISKFNALLFIGLNSILCFYTENLYYSLFGLGSCLIIAITSIRNSVGIFLGSISYSVYLLHAPIGQRIINFSENFIHNQYLLLVVVILSILIVLTLSYVYFLIVEWPSQILSKKISLKPAEK
jgi:peptidoglycan/LPS O-acetylase OafA/YrhL